MAKPTKQKLFTVADKMQAIAELEAIEVPWSVSRTGIKPSLFGSQVALNSNDSSDFVSLDEAKAVVEWLVVQFNGTVTWNDK